MASARAQEIFLASNDPFHTLGLKNDFSVTKTKISVAYVEKLKTLDPNDPAHKQRRDDIEMAHNILTDPRSQYFVNPQGMMDSARLALYYENVPPSKRLVTFFAIFMGILLFGSMTTVLLRSMFAPLINQRKRLHHAMAAKPHQVEVMAVTEDLSNNKK
eukprot:PhM_4_TR3245/c0_g2_i1/m.56955